MTRRRALRRAGVWIAASALALVAAPGAFAHGGAYRGPWTEALPDPAEPSMPPTPEEVAQRKAVMKEWHEGWRTWWAMNSDAFLLDREQMRERPPDLWERFDAGQGRRVRAAAGAKVAVDVVPVLRTLLVDRETSYDIRAACALALARMRDPSIVPALSAMVVNEKQQEHRVVRETAALALGLLGKDTDEVRALLTETVLGPDRGPSSYVRPFAAVALGLLAGNADHDRAAVEALVTVLSRTEPKEDVQAAALLAMGMLGDAAVTELLAVATTGRTTRKDAVELIDRDRSYAVSALGRAAAAGPESTGRGTVIADSLLKLLAAATPKESPHVRRSLVIALGGVGADAETRARIVAVLAERAGAAEVVPNERGFALIALGRIGAGQVHPQFRSEIVAALRKRLDEGTGFAPCYAAVALGMVMRAPNLYQVRPVPDPPACLALRAKLTNEVDPYRRGAYAIALGLARDATATAALRATLHGTVDAPHVRAACAEALALTGDADSAAALTKLIADDDAPREVRRHALPAVALLGGPDKDGTTLRAILGVFEDKESGTYELGAAANALGTLRDPRAIDPLVAIVADERNHPDANRAAAVAALGRMCERADLSPLARIGTDVNYRALVPAITELLTIL